MAEDRLKILEERLTRLEANLQRASGIGAGAGGGFTAVPSPVVDPAPWYHCWRPRWPYHIADPAPFPTPVVDPAPWPNPIADPATFAQSFAARMPSPIADPATFAQSLAGRIGKVADPAPPDITRYTVVQLESALHSIAAERARLDSMEEMINKQLETARKQQG